MMHANKFWIPIVLALTGCATDPSSPSRVELVASTGEVTPLGTYEPTTRALRFDRRVDEGADTWTVLLVGADQAPVPIEPGVVMLDRDLDSDLELPAFTLRASADHVGSPPEPAGAVRLVTDPDADGEGVGQSSAALVDSGDGGAPVACYFEPHYGLPEYWLHGCSHCFGWSGTDLIHLYFCW